MILSETKQRVKEKETGRQRERDGQWRSVCVCVEDGDSVHLPDTLRHNISQ